MAKKRGASQQRKPQGKNAPGSKPSIPTQEVGALAKLEKVAAQPAKEVRPTAARAPVSASAKFDTLTFTLACVIAVLLAVAGYYYLSSLQVPVSEAFSTSAVRLN